MTFIFPGLLFVIFLFCVAFLYTDGMWGNAVQLINVVTAALLAVNFWEWVARMLEGFIPSFTFSLDMIALWGLFCLFLLIFRTATRNVSAIKVSVKKIADQIGSVCFAAAVGAVMVCFTTMTLHTAPLAEKFMWGGFDKDKRMLFGVAPDRHWLGYVQYASKGPFCRWTTREFDPDSAFMDIYAERRKFLEEYSLERGGFTAKGDDLGGRIPKR